MTDSAVTRPVSCTCCHVELMLTTTATTTQSAPLTDGWINPWVVFPPAGGPLSSHDRLTEELVVLPITQHSACYCKTQQILFLLRHAPPGTAVTAPPRSNHPLPQCIIQHGGQSGEPPLHAADSRSRSKPLENRRDLYPSRLVISF